MYRSDAEPFGNPRHGGVLYHYGVGHLNGGHSGRYAWGSGKNPYQSAVSFRAYVDRERKANKTEAQIRASMNHMTKSKYEAKLQASKDAIGKHNAEVAKKMHDRGLSNRAIAAKLGVSEGTVRNAYLKEGYIEKRTKGTELQNLLKANVEKYGYIQVGKGVSDLLGESSGNLTKALANLEEHGYKVYSDKLYVKQMTTGGNTELKILAKDDTTKGDVVKAIKDARVHLPNKFIDEPNQNGVVKDEDKNWISDTPMKPASIDSSRIFIRYAEDGGLDKDGFIELRRGVPDISLGDSHYAQVRIAVDDKLYLKGMAAHTDDIPDGYDVVFNCNKKRGTSLEDVLKPLKDDPANPFGASIKPENRLIKCQKYYTDPETGEKKLSAINVVNEEGDWETWSKNLSSQFLGKQSLKLVKEQLGLAYEIKAGEYDEIMSVKNPTIRKALLEDFADECSTATWKLKGAMMPKQATQVLLPLTTLKDIETADPGGVVGEVYAPRYPDGQELVLVRFPHAHVSELPRVINNLSNPEGRKLIGEGSVEAIGVSPKIRQQLSGADTDGDTVVCIPDPLFPGGERRIITRKMLEAMKDFDPAEFARSKDEPTTKDHIKMKGKDKWNKGMQMGSVSNLITDMNQAGAPDEEIVRAMKHSMVVIDAEKHNYDWQKSEEVFKIKELKLKYQGREDAGAATIISRRKKDLQVDERKAGMEVYDPIAKKMRIRYVDPETGEQYYRETNRTYQSGKYRVDENGKYVRNENGGKIWDPDGKTKKAKSKVKWINEVDDAFELTSGGSKERPGTPREAAYAENANNYKALEKKARIEASKIVEPQQDKNAKIKYEKEDAELRSALNTARKNKPYETMAQILANKMYREVKDDLDTKDEESKEKNKLLSRAREIVGSNRQPIRLTSKQVEAINANAVPSSVVKEIYKNSDKTVLKQAFMPREAPKLSEARISKARQMIARGESSYQAIAEQFGVSVTTLYKALNE